ncbi:MAG: type 4a pilus biogenesis protein PilO [Candidatus Omnitrophota bacterium]
MINYSLIERNKSKIVNVVIIILALILAWHFYNSSSNQVNSLIQQQNSELEKNKVVEEIASLENKAEVYKKVFVRKDLASVMDIISSIAKNASVKIISVKPNTEEAMENYFNSSFLITLNAPSYHALGDFISKIENNQDICLVSEVKINSSTANANTEPTNLRSTATEVNPAAADVDLNVTLKINTIAYL